MKSAQSEEALKSRERFLSNVVENLPYGVLVLDPDGRVIIVNRVQEKQSKITRDMVLGTFFHETWRDLLARTEIGRHYWLLVHEKKPFELVFHDVYPQFYDVKISGLIMGAPLPEGEGYVITTHISNQIREDKHTLAILANTLSESKIFLQNLIDSSPSAILTVSYDGSIRSSNKTATEIFGYTKGDILWKQVSRLFADQLRIEELVSMASITSGVETMCRRKNGEVFHARMQIGDVISDDSTIRERLLILTDISREKDLEERLAISEKLAIYSELIAGIFHQINNPLVGVVNFSSLLLERMDPNDPNRPMVNTMHSAATQCLELVTLMVKGFREPQSTFRKVALGDLLGHAVDESLRIHADDAGGKITVERRFDPSLHAVMGDALQLGQVFRNILDNAFQAMPEGGRIVVDAAVDAGRQEVSLSFADSGCGIKKENISRIFTPFFSTKKNTGGGLGLSFAHRVVTNHSGRIEVASGTQGTVFTVVLPLYAAGADKGNES